MLWKKCSACKAEIQVNAPYYECSVSTCNGKRTGLAFCSIPCFERHLPGARHKDAAAIECTAPAQPATNSNVSSQSVGGVRRIVSSSTQTSAAPASAVSGKGDRNEVLIVASKLKKFIQDEAGMNTSQSVMNILSDVVRKAALEAIQVAQAEGRKTVMDRDFK